MNVYKLKYNTLYELNIVLNSYVKGDDPEWNREVTFQEIEIAGDTYLQLSFGPRQCKYLIRKSNET